MRKLVRKTFTGQFRPGGLVVMSARVHLVHRVSDRGHMYSTRCMEEMHWVGLAVAEPGNHPKCEDCFREAING